MDFIKTIPTIEAINVAQEILIWLQESLDDQVEDEDSLLELVQKTSNNSICFEDVATQVGVQLLEYLLNFPKEDFVTQTGDYVKPVNYFILKENLSQFQCLYSLIRKFHVFCPLTKLSLEDHRISILKSFLKVFFLLFFFFLD